jgi:tetratricopeptide (TPR) repeat protein
MGRVLMTLAAACVGWALGGCEASSPTSKMEQRPDIETIQDAPEPVINPETFVAAGDLAASRGQYGRACEQYEKALAGRPKDSGLAKKLALAYAKSGQMGKSIEAWQRYLVASDHSADAYGSLGYAYEQIYADGIRRHPQGALPRINYGLMLVRRNKVDEAITQMSAVLQAHEVNYNIASVYEQMGRRDLAQFYYRRSLECNPKFTPAKQKLASVE